MDKQIIGIDRMVIDDRYRWQIDRQIAEINEERKELNQTDRQMDKYVCGQANWVDGWMVGWVDEYTGRWVDGWVGGWWIDEQIE